VKNLEWEAEVLAQQFAAVQKERDELYDRFEASIHEVAQKTGAAPVPLRPQAASVSVLCWL
jgi:Growth-arrest specific micro-tubule binding